MGALSYVIRIYVNILIEPQVNPIKHFPVVTVSHKIMLPWLPTLTRLMAAPLTPFLGFEAASAFAGANVLLLPGAFGFLVWELKENWRLYEANRPARIPRIVIGRHGETMVRLFKPGLHSGTIPKLFAKLRRAVRDAYSSDPKANGVVARRRQDLHEVGEEIDRFFDREVLALFRIAGLPRLSQYSVRSVDLATNQALTAIGPADGATFVIDLFEDRDELRLASRLLDGANNLTHSRPRRSISPYEVSTK